MDRFDPYQQLGVDQHAGIDEIKKAYKRRSKETHPDAGGDAEAFHAVTRALAILSDPDRRAKFDNTGQVDDETIDLTRETALGIIDRFVAEVINDYMLKEMDPRFDPRQLDVIEVVAHKIEEEIAQLTRAAVQGERAIKEMRDIARRFKRKSETDAGDPIGHGFQRQIEGMISRREEVLKQIPARRMAISIVRDYAFERDAPVPRGLFDFPTSNVTSFVWPTS
jgi:curved DNA-binding protein CbpA